jgi:hypothetical protein
MERDIIINNQANYPRSEDFQPHLPESFAKRYDVDAGAFGEPKNQS